MPATTADMQRAIVEGSIRKELGLEPGDLRLGLDVARNMLHRGAIGEALRLYAALVLCEPAGVDFQVGLANCALQAGESDLALHAASAVIALAPRDPRGYLLSAKACLALGRVTEAEEDLKDAVAFGRDARNAAIVEDASGLLQRLASLNG